MGLERIAAVLQGVLSNYEHDLFTCLIARAAEISQTAPDADEDDQASLRIIADHARATVFLIADQVTPSNEGRGYVLRKIMRRALLHAHKLHPGEQGILYAVGLKVQRTMAGAYPELRESSDHIKDVIGDEALKFSRTLGEGLKKLESDLNRIRLSAPSHLVYPGEEAFYLYDTLGVPRDFIEDVCREGHFSVDWAGFEKAMEEEKKRARVSWKGGRKDAANPAYAKLAETFKTEPDFYFGTTAKDARIEAIILTSPVDLPDLPRGPRRVDATFGPVNELKAGESGEVILDRTAIYAESGGQVADTGAFYDNSESQLLAEVKGAFYPVAGLVAHQIVAKETLRVGDRVAVVAGAEPRARRTRDPTGTPPGDSELRKIFGAPAREARVRETP